jgi:hypothetical protein
MSGIAAKLTSAETLRADFQLFDGRYPSRFLWSKPRPRRDVAAELKLDWDTVTTLEMQYVRAQLKRAGTPERRRSGSTKSRSARATAIATWWAIWCASGPSSSP